MKNILIVLVLIAISFLAGYLYPKGVKVGSNAIKKIDTKIEGQETKEKAIEYSLRLKDEEISSHKERAAKAEEKGKKSDERAAVLEKKYLLAKALKPITIRDTVLIACDSAVNALDSALADKKKEIIELKEVLNSTEGKVILLDSAVQSLKTEVSYLKEKDSIRVEEIKDAKKKKVKAGIIGFILGFIAGKVS